MHRLIPLLFLLFTGLVAHVNAQTIAWRGLVYMDFNYFNPACSFADTVHSYQVSVWSKYRYQQLNISGENPLDAGLDFQGHVKDHSEWSYSAGYTWDGYSFLNLHELYGSIAYKWTWGIRSLSLGTRVRIYGGHMLWDNLAVPYIYKKYPVYIFPDMDFGLDYRVKSYSVRFSCLNAFAPPVGTDSIALLRCERKFILDQRFDCNIANKVLMVPHFLLAFGSHTIYAQLGLYIDFWHYVHISADLCGADLNQMYSIGTDLPFGLSLDFGVQYAPFHNDINFDAKLGYRF